jgi:hypothetical protein
MLYVRGFLMKDYIREISYIYSYNQGIKNRNVGFSKLELRENKCKITISLKTSYGFRGENLKVYLFVKRKDFIEGVLIGEMIPINSNSVFKKHIDALNIENSGFTIDDIGGVYIAATSYDENCFIAGRQDVEISTVNFVEHGSLDDIHVFEIDDTENTRNPVIELMKDYIRKEQKEKMCCKCECRNV